MPEQTDEEYVRAAWDRVWFESVAEAAESWEYRPQAQLPKDRGRVVCERPGGGVWILSGNSNTRSEISKALPAELAWQAARAYTEEVVRKVAEIDRQIETVKLFVKSRETCKLYYTGIGMAERFKHQLEDLRGILSLLQRERESTARGLKQEGG